MPCGVANIRRDVPVGGSSRTIIAGQRKEEELLEGQTATFLTAPAAEKDGIAGEKTPPSKGGGIGYIAGSNTQAEDLETDFRVVALVLI